MLIFGLNRKILVLKEEEREVDHIVEKRFKFVLKILMEIRVFVEKTKQLQKRRELL